MSAVVSRIAVMAEMHGRDLTRRHVALALLVALPLSFYLASGGSGGQAVAAGGIGMAFAVSGATFFSVLSSSEVDQRLVLGGYRPVELLIGRVLFLAPLGLAIAAGFAAVMVAMSDPAEPWVTALGVAVVALVSVPFGLAVGAVVPRELEGTLVLIGVIGLQMAADGDAVVSKVLPFYGARQILSASLSGDGSIVGPLLVSAVYSVGLLVLARVFIDRRVNIRRHGELRSIDG